MKRSKVLSPAARAFRAIKKAKKPKLRRKSLQPIPRLKTKADRALQDFYRREDGGIFCEGCNMRPFELMHHFYEKSQSAGLRFEVLNLVYLCKGCHFRHHNTGDAEIMSAVIRKRGMKWLHELAHLKVARKGQQLDRKYLEEQLVRFK